MHGGAFMKAFVTGGAGFIGSNLVARLLKEGARVTAYDDLSLGRIEFLRPFFKNRKFRFIRADILTDRKLASRLKGHDVVFHMQANSDIPRGLNETDWDMRLGTIATHRILEAMRESGAKKIVFASSSVVYGEAMVKPTPEDYGPLFPISLYGASKLASEGLITAFAHCYGIRAWIFRFGNVAGRNGTHGIIVDLMNQLKRRPKYLKVLGDGNQAKPYIHVDDCVDGMLFGLSRSKKDVNCFNLTNRGATKVKAIVKLLIMETGKKIPVRFSGGRRGWPGDVPQVRLDGTKMAKLGWAPRISSDQAVRRSVVQLVKQMAKR